MRSLGLIYKYEVSGFSVLLDKNKEQDFLDYLNAQFKAASPISPVWPRLSFLLTTRNPNFVNFTRMPIDLSPGATTFYLSNTEARTIHDKVYLGPEVLTRTNALPMTGSQLSVSVIEGITNVLMKDVAGEVVIPPPPTVVTDNTGSVVSPTFLNLTPYPEGKYLVQQYDATDATSPVAGSEVVYVYTAASPMFFMDLLFEQPSNLNSGVYPVQNIEGNLSVVPIEYTFLLHHRTTIWNYYIVSTGAPLTDLQIETIAASSAPRTATAGQSAAPLPNKIVTFSGPTSVQLLNKQRANLFVSDAPLPLQEQSTCNFQLKGLVGGLKTKNGVLMKRLPVASSQQVIPGQSSFATEETALPNTRSSGNYSDIYVYV